jgi:purine nucleoside phosphorylase
MHPMKIMKIARIIELCTSLSVKVAVVISTAGKIASEYSEVKLLVIQNGNR